MPESMIEFQVTSDAGVIDKSVPTKRLVEISLRAPKAARRETRPAFNLALVLDVSGSMAGDKLANTKRAAAYLLDQLRESDQAALVVYDSEVQVLAEMQAMTQEHRNQVRQKIDLLKAGSMTNLSGGWLEGCRQVGLVHASGAVNRALLLSDGLANVGITDREELGEHARQLSQRGVTTSTFGAGSDYDEHLLEVIANQGDGNYYYIDQPNSIPEIFRRELEEIAAITVQGVTLTITIPPHTSLQIPGEWRSEQVGDQLRVSIGDLASEQQRNLYLEVLAPPSDDSTLEIHLIMQAHTPGGQEIKREAHVKFTYGSASEVASTARDAGLLERYYLVSTAQVASESLRLDREGRRAEADRLLERQLAAAQPHMAQEDLKAFLRLRQKMSQGLDIGERKAASQEQYRIKRSKNQDPDK
ncbi:MAG TPA: VWA domain-containing protein [Longilinea sp.]|nr:VWA domain-containing protein [Longilinea sp.]